MSDQKLTQGRAWKAVRWALWIASASVVAHYVGVLIAVVQVSREGAAKQPTAHFSVTTGPNGERVEELSVISEDGATGLILACVGPVFSLFSAPGQFHQSDERSPVIYRFDSNDPVSSSWITDGNAVSTFDATDGFMQQMIASSQVVFTFLSPQQHVYTRTFKVAALKADLAKLDCLKLKKD